MPAQQDKIDAFIPVVNPKDTPPELVAKMAEQAKSKTTSVTADVPADTKPEVRPEGLPEKFKTVADMIKAYGELEKKQSGQKSPATAEGTPPAAGATADDKAKGLDALKMTPEQEAASKVVTDAGLKMDEFSDEFAKNRALSAESYAKLDKAGIPKAMVDSYIAGQEAIAEKIHNEITAIAGGQEQFDQMFAWGGTNMSAPDKAALNKAIDSNDHGQIKLAFKALHAQWTQAGEAEPRGQIHGTASTSTAGDRYETKDDLMKDMRNPEYQANEGFRNRVAAKIKRSSIL